MACLLGTDVAELHQLLSESLTHTPVERLHDGGNPYSGYAATTGGCCYT